MFKLRKSHTWDPYAARLKRKEIRLFVLRLDDTDVLSICVLPFQRKVVEPTGYTAISYVCGDGGASRKIIVNGQPFRILENLFSVLLELKKSYYNSVLAYRDQPPLSDSGYSTSCLLWADAICINQGDLVEKAQQIREMDYIYKRASRVHIAAGASTDHFDCLALVCLWLQSSHELERPRLQRHVDGSLNFSYNPIDIPKPDLEERLKKSYDIDQDNLVALLTSVDGWNGNFSKASISDFERSLDNQHYIPWDHPFWLICLDFFELEYFSRLWTYQEFWLARQEESHIRVGNHDIRLEHLSNVFFCLVGRDKPITESMVWNEVTERLNKFRLRKVELIWAWKYGRQEIDIWGLLALSSQRLATEAQDHVYALLGSLSQEARQLILVDYDIPHAHIFADAIAAAIEQGEDPCGLPHLWDDLSMISPRTKGLASWCPDLANENRAKFGEFSAMPLPEFSAFAKISICRPSGSTRLRVAVMKAVARYPRLSVFAKPLTCRHVMAIRARVGIVDTIAQCLATAFPASKDFSTSIEHHGSKWAVMGSIAHRILELQTLYPEPNEDAADPRYFGLRLANLEIFLDLIIQREARKSPHTGRPGSPTIDAERNQDPSASTDFVWNQQVAAVYKRSTLNFRVASSICSMCLKTPNLTIAEVADLLSSDLKYFNGSQLESVVTLTHSPSAKLLLLKSAMRFMENLSRGLEGTYIFKTSKGDIGHSPRRLHPGDNICIVPGAKLLHVLSADKTRYVSSAAAFIPFDEDKWAGLSHEEQESFFEEVTLH